MALDFLAHVRTESDRFAAALRDVDPAARVPSCPEWTAADLLWHLTEVHHFWAVIVGERIVDEAAIDGVESGTPVRPEGFDELHGLYERTTAQLVAALASADDADPVWTWATDGSVGFVRRFQAHEAMIHRVDAELAAGAALTPLPADLATDGIDVVLRFQKTWRPSWADWQLSDAVGHLATTDTGDEWTVRLGRWSGASPDTGKTYDGVDAIQLLEDANAEHTFSITAPAADLDAWLWHRPGFGEVTIDGDADRFVELVKGGVQ